MIEIISDLVGRTRHQRTIRFSKVVNLPDDARVAFLAAGAKNPVLLATVIAVEFCNFPVYAAGDVLSLKVRGPSSKSMIDLVNYYLEEEKRRVVVFDNDVELFNFIAEFARSGYSEIPPVRLGEKRAREVARKVRRKK